MVFRFIPEGLAPLYKAPKDLSEMPVGEYGPHAREAREREGDYSQTLDLNQRLVAERFPLKDGFVAIPNGPGLGIELDEAALKDLIRAAVALNLEGKSKPKPRRANTKRAD